MRADLYFTKKILMAIILGFVFGAAMKWPPLSGLESFAINTIIDFIAQIFIIFMKMLVIPIVFVSLICGVMSIENIKTLSRIGTKTLLLYLFSTAVAITLAIFFAKLFHIGVGANFPLTESFQLASPVSTKSVLLGLLPKNPFAAFSEGNMLQILFFAIIFAVAMNMAQKKSKGVFDIFKGLNAINFQLIYMLMAITPYGVFALIAKLSHQLAFADFKYLLAYFFTVIFVLVVHVLFTNGLLLILLGRIKPWPFFKKILPTMLFSFSTSSSNASIPVTLRNVEEVIGVDNQVASFGIPLGATINMDGTAIMQGVATIFIANVYNIHLGLPAFLMIILTATLASIGTAGIPGIGLITLALVLKQVGLPVEGIALIIGIDRILDMIRTAVNVTGDASICTIVAKSENKLDLETYYQ